VAPQPTTSAKIVVAGGFAGRRVAGQGVVAAVVPQGTEHIAVFR